MRYRYREVSTKAGQCEPTQPPLHKGNRFLVAVVDIANTMTAHEFNQAGKLRHLDVYLQHEM